MDNLKGTLTASGTISGKIVISGGGTGRLQEKSAVPSDSVQVIRPDTGYDGLSIVTVGAIPSNYGHIAQNGNILRVY